MLIGRRSAWCTKSLNAATRRGGEEKGKKKKKGGGGGEKKGKKRGITFGPLDVHKLNNQLLRWEKEQKGGGGKRERPTPLDRGPHWMKHFLQPWKPAMESDYVEKGREKKKGEDPTTWLSALKVCLIPPCACGPIAGGPKKKKKKEKEEGGKRILRLPGKGGEEKKELLQWPRTVNFPRTAAVRWRRKGKGRVPE